jgi:hypothetical protein
MKTKAVIYLAIGAAAAFAADTMIWGRDVAPGLNPERNAPGATRELRWDNGTWKWLVCWYTGKDSWAGNDFADSITEPMGRDTNYKSTRIINVRVFSSNKWPNERWDGFRVAIYEFDNYNRIPGEMLWPTGGTGYFFKPSGLNGEVWVDVPVNWVTSGVCFVAAMEQAYDQPRCDPFAVDTNRNFLEHSWMLYGGSWKLLQTTSDPYFNLMLRVVVEYLPYWPAVAPSSIGRVRALYR